MKIVNYAKFIASPEEKVAELRPAHHEYMLQLLAEGRLVVAGPFTNGSGGLFIYETESVAAAQEIVAADPFQVGGAFASYTLTPWEVRDANLALISGTEQ